MQAEQQDLITRLCSPLVGSDSNSCHCNQTGFFVSSFFFFMLDYDFKVVLNHQGMPKEQYYQKQEC